MWTHALIRKTGMLNVKENNLFNICCCDGMYQDLLDFVVLVGLGYTCIILHVLYYLHNTLGLHFYDNIFDSL